MAKNLITLSNGAKLQQLGFGTWQSAKGEVGAAVETALKAGYRHLDLARVYGNQQEIGQAIRKSGVPRSELFLTSKLWNTAHKPENVKKDIDRTLEQLGVDYLDLWLIHWPVAFEPTSDIDELFPRDPSDKSVTHLDSKTSIVDTWKAVIDVKKSGKVKAIGVSNFTIEMTKAVIDATGEVPAVNQIERHPRLSQPELIEWHYEKGIHIEAYSPLGNNTAGHPKIIDEEPFVEYAKSIGKDAGALALAWGLYLPASRTKSGKAIPIVVLSKSVTPSRIEKNFQALEPLTEEQYKVIDEQIVPKVGGELRTNVPATYDPKWPINIWNDKAEKNQKASVKFA